MEAAEQSLTDAAEQSIMQLPDAEPSESDDEDARLEAKYGIAAARLAEYDTDDAASDASFLPDMSFDSRQYMRSHGLATPSRFARNATPQIGRTGDPRGAAPIRHDHKAAREAAS
ncbi:hypothetical protein WJX72_005238 [[Myrmecia] bisecta]|uniref:Uncharacterized protein n=1 Tax=[Myrmecia] bisecta TaxID=41462 RepID=A0AAW1P4E9_9CHLO